MTSHAAAQLMGYIVSLTLISAAGFYTIKATVDLRKRKLGLWWLLVGVSCLLVATAAGHLVVLATAMGWIGKRYYLLMLDLLSLSHLLQAGGAVAIGLACLRVSNQLQARTVKRIIVLSALLLVIAMALMMFSNSNAGDAI